MKKLFGEKSKPRTFLNALVVFVLIFAFFICILLTACDNKIDKDKTNKTPTQNEQTGGNQGGQENQGSQTGGNQGSQTGENQGSQTGGNQGGQTGGNQGGQTGGNQGGQTGGETGGEETPNPEKTPAEYKAECEQKLVQAVSSALQTKYKLSKFRNISLVKVNTNGSIYATATCKTYTGFIARDFYKLSGDLSGDSYKELSQKYDSLSLTVDEESTIMDASELGDKYNALCNYVLSQCDLQDSEILNVAKFTNTTDGTNLRETFFTVLYNNEIFTLNARTSAPSSDSSTVIDCLIVDNGLTKSVTITSRSTFKDFDNIVSAEG